MADDDLDTPVVFRGMLRDVVRCSDYNEVCRMLGLVPSGPDVDYLEHYAKHERVHDFSYVGTTAIRYADVAAEVVYKLMHAGDDKEPNPKAHAMFQFVSRTAVATVISHLIENGTLEIGVGNEQ